MDTANKKKKKLSLSAKIMIGWIMFKQDGLEYPRLYNHWILGQDAVPKQPRWSIIRDVLKWVK